MTPHPLLSLGAFIWNAVLTHWPKARVTAWVPRLRGLVRRGVLVFTLMVGAISAVQAQVPTPEASVGMVKTLTGQGFVDVNGQRYPAVLGMPVYLGSALVTLGRSTMGVTFRDETVMSIGPDTQLVIDQYLFVPQQGQLSLVASLLRGTLNYVSGRIAKLRPDAVNVNTPTGMIGVRGTQFVVRVDPS